MTAALGGEALGAGAGAEAAGAGAAGKAAGQGAKASTRASDTAKGAGLGSMLDGGLLGRAGRSASKTVLPASNARRFLVAEFAVCMVVLAFSPLTGKSPTAGAFMKRGSAIMGLFFALGLVATAGRGAARAASGFGGLVTLVLLISERSIFTKLTSKLGKGVGEDDPSDGLDAQDQADAAGLGDDGNPLGDHGGSWETPAAPDPNAPLPALGPVFGGIR